METIHLQLWHAVTLFLMFLGASAGAAKLLLKTHLKHFDARFDSVESQAKEWHELERKLMELRAELPDKYVRREDYIRGQSTIEAKLDGLAVSLQNVELKAAVKGVNNGLS